MRNFSVEKQYKIVTGRILIMDCKKKKKKKSAENN